MQGSAALREKKSKVIFRIHIYKLNFLSHRSTTILWWGTFFLSQEKAVYSIEQCKEIWWGVSFRHEKAHLFQACEDCASCQRRPGKFLFLYLFILFHVYLFLFSMLLFFLNFLFNPHIVNHNTADKKCMFFVHVSLNYIFAGTWSKVANGIRTGDLRGFNKGRSSKFREGSPSSTNTWRRPEDTSVETLWK